MKYSCPNECLIYDAIFLFNTLERKCRTIEVPYQYKFPQISISRNPKNLVPSRSLEAILCQAICYRARPRRSVANLFRLDHLQRTFRARIYLLTKAPEAFQPEKIESMQLTPREILFLACRLPSVKRVSPFADARACPVGSFEGCHWLLKGCVPLRAQKPPLCPSGSARVSRKILTKEGELLRREEKESVSEVKHKGSPSFLFERPPGTSFASRLERYSKESRKISETTPARETFPSIKSFCTINCRIRCVKGKSG